MDAALLVELAHLRRGISSAMVVNEGSGIKEVSYKIAGVVGTTTSSSTAPITLNIHCE